MLSDRHYRCADTAAVPRQAPLRAGRRIVLTTAYPQRHRVPQGVSTKAHPH